MNEDARLYAPAAARNREPIFEVLRRHLPQRGLVLEIASGSGEHAAHFAQNSGPGLVFQPSDPDPAACASIDAWSAASGSPNVRPALALDVTSPDWPLSCPRTFFSMSPAFPTLPSSGAVLCFREVRRRTWRR